MVSHCLCVVYLLILPNIGIGIVKYWYLYCQILLLVLSNIGIVKYWQISVLSNIGIGSQILVHLAQY